MSGFWRNRRVLVTGGYGFLGRVLVEKLQQRGARVSSPRSGEYDLTRAGDMFRLFADVEPHLVVHLAARVGGIGLNRERPADLYVSNLLMGTYLLEEARRRQTAKTVILGTVCSYPKLAPIPFAEESLWDGYPEETNAAYGIAKKALLVHAQANRQQYGQQVIYLLPTNLYGPGDHFDPRISHVVPALIRKCVEAKEQGDGEIEVWGTGRATREFLYVDDAAEGVILAAERYDDPAPVNLGSGTETNIADLAAMIARLTGFAGSFRWDASRPDGQPRRSLDATKAARAFGFRATTPLPEGLEATIRWYLAHRREAESKPYSTAPPVEVHESRT